MRPTATLFLCIILAGCSRQYQRTTTITRTPTVERNITNRVDAVESRLEVMTVTNQWQIEDIYSVLKWTLIASVLVANVATFAVVRDLAVRIRKIEEKGNQPLNPEGLRDQTGIENKAWKV